MTVNKCNTWQPVHGVLTPGGDPAWKCPNCGDIHVYGIESVTGPYDQCPKCRMALRYLKQ